MRQQHPINTAPQDGSTVTVIWTDFDGQTNESPARYRNLEQLQKAGGDWDSSDTGWWTFIDSTTQKKIDPTAWIENPDEQEDD
ncbi:hypothetical protein [Pseudochrobactrum sp. MP213Fo]|uniref:hypothetical protein n=1 Tax=Pseudochrobactrum sp. MP213Fo TaxID=3022250 RepID=UPI003B9E816F